MNKAYRFRAMPNAEQRVLFAKTVGCARFVYNRMLADKIACYKETGKMLHNTPAQYKGELPFLREVDSMALWQCPGTSADCLQEFLPGQVHRFPEIPQ